MRDERLWSPASLRYQLPMFQYVYWLPILCYIRKSFVKFQNMIGAGIMVVESLIWFFFVRKTKFTIILLKISISFIEFTMDVCHAKSQANWNNT